MKTFLDTKFQTFTVKVHTKVPHTSLLVYVESPPSLLIRITLHVCFLEQSQEGSIKTKTYLTLSGREVFHKKTECGYGIRVRVG
jgi:hypothetical protein